MQNNAPLTDLIISALPIVATVMTGLLAGLFYGFACAVMPGLQRVDDRTFVDTMRSINRRIVNGWFLLCFLGAPVLTLAAAVGQFVLRGEDSRWPIAGAVAFSAASLVITAAVNVPLNNALDAADDPARSTDPAVIRRRFEGRWVRWNIGRTAASTGAFACLVWATACGA